MTINSFPTLEAARLLEGNASNGLCFHRSAALCYDLPKSMVVIGVFQPSGLDEPDASLIPFYHCWVEYCGRVLAPTTIERFNGELVPMDRNGYYNINGVTKVKRIARSQLLYIFQHTPELLNQLRHGIMPTREGLLVDKLMKAAKLRYQLSETNGVIP
jgi:hypothetical protein